MKPTRHSVVLFPAVGGFIEFFMSDSLPMAVCFPPVQLRIKSCFLLKIIFDRIGAMWHSEVLRLRDTVVSLRQGA